MFNYKVMAEYAAEHYLDGEYSIRSVDRKLTDNEGNGGLASLIEKGYKNGTEGKMNNPVIGSLFANSADGRINIPFESDNKEIHKDILRRSMQKSYSFRGSSDFICNVLNRAINKELDESDSEALTKLDIDALDGELIKLKENRELFTNSWLIGSMIKGSTIPITYYAAKENAVPVKKNMPWSTICTYNTSDVDEVTIVPEGRKITKYLKYLAKKYDVREDLLERLLSELEYLYIFYSKEQQEINTEGLTLTLSINPLDILTLSDNNKNWDSCLAIGSGHNAGTYGATQFDDLMVAFLHKDNYYECDDFIIPDKVWRELVYVNSSGFGLGQGYPYNSQIAEKTIADFLMSQMGKLKPAKWHEDNNINFMYDDLKGSTATDKYFTKDGSDFVLKENTYKDPLRSHTEWMEDDCVGLFCESSLEEIGFSFCYECGGVIDTDEDQYYELQNSDYRKIVCVEC